MARLYCPTRDMARLDCPAQDMTRLESSARDLIIQPSPTLPLNVRLVYGIAGDVANIRAKFDDIIVHAA